MRIYNFSHCDILICANNVKISNRCFHHFIINIFTLNEKYYTCDIYTGGPQFFVKCIWLTDEDVVYNKFENSERSVLDLLYAKQWGTRLDPRMPMDGVDLTAL